MNSNNNNDTHKQHMSMLISSQKSERPMTKLDNDFQLTAFGRILRQTSLDELPQLINVLCGDMSLVGPRPPIPYEADEYSPWHYARFNAVPGMTGLWQVSGKNRLTFPEMVQLDIQYSRRLSLCSDIMILLKTPLAIASDIKDSFVYQKKLRLVRKVDENA
jgi:lipopolysaccharide/colanic/teichoic acid biosynthesis glycosyltransferase